MSEQDDTEQRDVFIDADEKRRWGEGPWLSEPDRVEWRHKGYACLLVRGPLGSWCGYVGVPPGHPWFGADLDLDADAPGGITYAAACEEGGHICHVPRPGEPPEVYWVGFDFGHSGDYMPKVHAELAGLPSSLSRRSKPYDHEQALAQRGRRPFWERDDVYATEQMARNEVVNLAEQAVEAAAKGKP